MNLKNRKKWTSAKGSAERTRPTVEVVVDAEDDKLIKEIRTLLLKVRS